MSAAIKIQLSRLAIIASLTVFLFGSVGVVAMAQGATSFIPSAESAKTVADMNAMQLLAYIALASIGALVVVVGFYVRSVSAFQKETAQALAGITTALNDVARNCNARCAK